MTRGRNYFRANPSTPSGVGCSSVISPLFWDTTFNVGNITYSNGNRTATNTTNAFRVAKSVNGKASPGSYYAEMTPTFTGTIDIGIAESTVAANARLGVQAVGWAYTNNGDVGNNNSYNLFGAVITAGDVIGLLLDFDDPFDAAQIAFSLNGAVQGTAFTNLNQTTYFLAASSNAIGAAILLSTKLSQFSFFPGGIYSSWG